MYQLLKTEARGNRDQMPPNRLRREGWVPGVIYGKGMNSVPFRVPTAEWKKFWQRSHSKIFEVDVAGERHLVSLEKVQKDALGSHVMHLEFHHLNQSEQTIITLPIRLVGEAPGLKAGGIVVMDHHEVDVKGLPRDFVECIEVNVSSLEVNHSIHLSDITPPRGLTWVESAETVIAHCSIPRMKVEPEVEAAPAPVEVANEAPADEQKKAS